MSQVEGVVSVFTLESNVKPASNLLNLFSRGGLSSALTIGSRAFPFRSMRQLTSIVAGSSFSERIS